MERIISIFDQLVGFFSTKTSSEDRIDRTDRTDRINQQVEESVNDMINDIEIQFLAKELVDKSIKTVVEELNAEKG